MTKHTPGPWRIEEVTQTDTGIRFLDIVSDAPGQPVIATVGDWRSREPSDADACLIAAAPEMLEMMYEALEMLDLADQDRFDGGNLTGDIRRVLAKAEGRKP